MIIPDIISPPAQRPLATTQLDANEMPFNTPLNRYPDEKSLTDLAACWGRHERIPAQCIYFTNGTEEAVDLAQRIFAIGGRDSVASISPTRTIYRRRAILNRLEYREAALKAGTWALKAATLLDTISNTTQLIFLCSPNSPTGNLLEQEEIKKVLDEFSGWVVVDESYIDFSPQATLLPLINHYERLILLRSFSHAWASASLRLCAVVAQPGVIENFRRMGLTHPLSGPVLQAASDLSKRKPDVDKWCRQIIAERIKVERALRDLPDIKVVYPSQANFLFAHFGDDEAVYHYLLKEGIAVKYCDNGLRITVGHPNDNSVLIGALRRRT